MKTQFRKTISASTNKLSGRYRMPGDGFGIDVVDGLFIHVIPTKVRSAFNLGKMIIDHSYFLKLLFDVPDEGIQYSLELDLDEDEFIDLVYDLAAMSYDEVIEFFEHNRASVENYR